MSPLFGLIVFFVLGIAALLIELVVPGGIVGTVAFVLLAVAVFFGFRHSPTAGIGALVAVAMCVPIVLLVAMRWLPHSPIGKRLTQHSVQDPNEGFVASEKGLDDLQGKTGVAATYLRPAGIAEIDGRRISVVTQGIMVQAGSAIRVIDVEGNRVVVEPVETGTV